MNKSLYAAVVVLAAFLAGCGDKKDAPLNKAQAAAKPAPRDPQVVQLTPDLAALVKTGSLADAEVTDTLRIAGRLEVNGYRTARIGAPVTGRITDIKAVLGQEVRHGEMLANLSSQELTAAQLAFLKAHSAEQLNFRSAERAQLLLSADVIGSAELQRRQNELAVSRAEKRAAADQLRVLGLASGSIERLEKSGAIIAVAPIDTTQSGVVIERKIALGQVVQPSDILFVVSDLSSIWAGADIPEQEAADARRGQKVEIEIPALEGAKRTGKIVYVADVVNPETRTVRVSVDLDNPERKLKPGMLITMLIDGRSAKRQVVPAAAVVREADADHLFVETAPNTVRLTRVKLGVERGGMRPVLDKLPDNTRIVLDGGFHLNNERQRRNLDSAAQGKPS